MIGYNYGDPFPWGKLVPGETVYMVDVCLEPWLETMPRLNQHNNLVWIDHHKSSIADHDAWSIEAEESIAGTRAVGVAACMLTWQELYASNTVPPAVALLSAYDVWDNLDQTYWYQCVLPFQYRMRVEETDPARSQSLDPWSVFLGRLAPMDQFVREGHQILKYQSQLNAKIAAACAFETDLDGLRCIAINQALGNSLYFDSVYDPARHDVMLAFSWRANGSWSVSLYCDKPGIDISIVCKARGGGGHEGAAGFVCAELPFELKEHLHLGLAVAR